MKYIFKYLILFILFFQQNTFAQQANIQDSIRLKHLPKLIFNLAPMALLEPIPYLQAGVEYRLKNYWYATHEAGWGFSYPSKSNNTLTGNIKGLRLQNSIRYYIPNNQHITKDNNSFVGIELLFKNENYTIAKWYNMASGAYSQRFDVKHTRRVLGLSFITGIKFLPYKSPVTIELMGGVGLRYRQVTKENPPKGVDIEQQNDFVGLNEVIMGLNGDERFLPHIKGGVRIGFIGKR